MVGGYNSLRKKIFFQRFYFFKKSFFKQSYKKKQVFFTILLEKIMFIKKKLFFFFKNSMKKIFFQKLSIQNYKTRLLGLAPGRCFYADRLVPGNRLPSLSLEAPKGKCWWVQAFFVTATHESLFVRGPHNENNLALNLT